MANQKFWLNGNGEIIFSGEYPVLCVQCPCGSPPYYAIVAVQERRGDYWCIVTPFIEPWNYHQIFTSDVPEPQNPNDPYYPPDELFAAHTNYSPSRLQNVRFQYRKIENTSLTVECHLLYNQNYECNCGSVSLTTGFIKHIALSQKQTQLTPNITITHSRDWVYTDNFEDYTSHLNDFDFPEKVQYFVYQLTGATTFDGLAEIIRTYGSEEDQEDLLIIQDNKFFINPENPTQAINGGNTYTVPSNAEIYEGYVKYNNQDIFIEKDNGSETIVFDYVQTFKQEPKTITIDSTTYPTFYGWVDDHGPGDDEKWLIYKDDIGEFYTLVDDQKYYLLPSDNLSSYVSINDVRYELDFYFKGDGRHYTSFININEQPDLSGDYPRCYICQDEKHNYYLEITNDKLSDYFDEQPQVDVYEGYYLLRNNILYDGGTNAMNELTGISVLKGENDQLYFIKDNVTGYVFEDAQATKTINEQEYQPYRYFYKDPVDSRFYLIKNQLISAMYREFQPPYKENIISDETIIQDVVAGDKLACVNYSYGRPYDSYYRNFIVRDNQIFFNNMWKPIETDYDNKTYITFDNQKMYVEIIENIDTTLYSNYIVITDDIMCPINLICGQIINGVAKVYNNYYNIPFRYPQRPIEQIVDFETGDKIVYIQKDKNSFKFEGYYIVRTYVDENDVQYSKLLSGDVEFEVLTDSNDQLYFEGEYVSGLIFIEAVVDDDSPFQYYYKESGSSYSKITPISGEFVMVGWDGFKYPNNSYTRIWYRSWISERYKIFNLQLDDEIVYIQPNKDINIPSSKIYLGREHIVIPDCMVYDADYVHSDFNLYNIVYYDNTSKTFYTLDKKGIQTNVEISLSPSCEIIIKDENDYVDGDVDLERYTSNSIYNGFKVITGDLYIDEVNKDYYYINTEESLTAQVQFDNNRAWIQYPITNYTYTGTVNGNKFTFINGKEYTIIQQGSEKYFLYNNDKIYLTQGSNQDEYTCEIFKYWLDPSQFNGQTIDLEDSDTNHIDLFGDSYSIGYKGNWVEQNLLTGNCNSTYWYDTTTDQLYEYSPTPYDFEDHWKVVNIITSEVDPPSEFEDYCSETRPTDPVKGQVWQNSNTYNYFYYDGQNWIKYYDNNNGYTNVTRLWFNITNKKLYEITTSPSWASRRIVFSDKSPLELKTNMYLYDNIDMKFYHWYYEENYTFYLYTKNGSDYDYDSVTNSIIHSNEEPLNVDTGALWYSKEDRKLKKFDGTEWEVVDLVYENDVNSTAPSNPYIGMIYQYRDSNWNERLRQWNGTSWVSWTSAKYYTVSFDLDMQLSSFTPHFNQNIAPSLANNEDFWFNNTTNKLFRFGNGFYYTIINHKTYEVLPYKYDEDYTYWFIALPSYDNHQGITGTISSKTPIINGIPSGEEYPQSPHIGDYYHNTYYTCIAQWDGEEWITFNTPPQSPQKGDYWCQVPQNESYGKYIQWDGSKWIDAVEINGENFLSLTCLKVPDFIDIENVPSTKPNQPKQGDYWYDMEHNIIKQWNISEWNDTNIYPYTNRAILLKYDEDTNSYTLDSRFIYYLYSNTITVPEIFTINDKTQYSCFGTIWKTSNSDEKSYIYKYKTLNTLGKPINTFYFMDENRNKTFFYRTFITGDEIDINGIIYIVHNEEGLYIEYPQSDKTEITYDGDTNTYKLTIENYEKQIPNIDDTSSTQPQSPEIGDYWKERNIIKQWNGTEWVVDAIVNSDNEIDQININGTMAPTTFSSCFTSGTTIQQILDSSSYDIITNIKKDWCKENWRYEKINPLFSSYIVCKSIKDDIQIGSDLESILDNESNYTPDTYDVYIHGGTPIHDPFWRGIDSYAPQSDSGPNSIAAQMAAFRSTINDNSMKNIYIRFGKQDTMEWATRKLGDYGGDPDVIEANRLLVEDMCTKSSVTCHVFSCYVIINKYYEKNDYDYYQERYEIGEVASGWTTKAFNFDTQYLVFNTYKILKKYDSSVFNNYQFFDEYSPPTYNYISRDDRPVVLYYLFVNPLHT